MSVDTAPRGVSKELTAAFVARKTTALQPIQKSGFRALGTQRERPTGSYVALRPEVPTLVLPVAEAQGKTPLQEEETIMTIKADTWTGGLEDIKKLLAQRKSHDRQTGGQEPKPDASGAGGPGRGKGDITTEGTPEEPSENNGENGIWRFIRRFRLPTGPYDIDF